MTLDFSDGTLTLSATAECALYARYDNRVSPASIITQIAVGDYLITLIRSPFIAPETMTVFDRATGLSYSVVVPDFASGEVCVPVGGMA